MYEKCYVSYAFPNLVIINTSHQTMSFYFGGMLYVILVLKNGCHWKTVDCLKAENSVVVLFSPFNCCMFIA
jgi:hypothetical protein